MFALQIINDTEPISLTLHGVLHLSANVWLKIQNTHCYRNLAAFSMFGELAVNASATDPVVIYSKIQKKLTRVP